MTAPTSPPPSGDLHLSDEEIMLYLQGELLRDRSAWMATHTEGCLMCANRLKQAAQLEDLLSDAVADMPTPMPTFAERIRVAWAGRPSLVLGGGMAVAALALMLVSVPSTPPDFGDAELALVTTVRSVSPVPTSPQFKPGDTVSVTVRPNTPRESTITVYPRLEGEDGLVWTLSPFAANGAEAIALDVDLGALSPPPKPGSLTLILEACAPSSVGRLLGLRGACDEIRARLDIRSSDEGSE